MRYKKNCMNLKSSEFIYIPFRTSNGFTYIALLAVIVIVGITMGSAAKSWQNISLRDKEEELLFRGDQYSQAIERFTSAIPGNRLYPQSIDELLLDNRTPQGKRHLRQKYLDPITGKDFIEIRDPLTNRIIGVHSPSDKEPLKQGNFPGSYQEFEGKRSYSEWKFQFMPKQGQLQSSPSPTAQQQILRPRLRQQKGQ